MRLEILKSANDVFFNEKNCILEASKNKFKLFPWKKISLKGRKDHVLYVMMSFFFFLLTKLTVIAFHFEASSDNVVRVRIHPESKRRAVAPGSIIVIGSENLNDLLRLRIFR